MARPGWPAGVRGGDGRHVRKDGYGYRPADTVRESEQEVGRKRRRVSTLGWRTHTLTLRLPFAEFDAFEAWVADVLADGVLEFDWVEPRGTAPVRARLVATEGRVYSVRAAPGANVFVDLAVEAAG